MDKSYWLFILGYASNRSRGSPSTQEGQLVRLRGREGTPARKSRGSHFWETHTARKTEDGCEMVTLDEVRSDPIRGWGSRTQGDGRGAGIRMQVGVPKDAKKMWAFLDLGIRRLRVEGGCSTQPKQGNTEGLQERRRCVRVWTRLGEPIEVRIWEGKLSFDTESAAALAKDRQPFIRY